MKKLMKIKQIARVALQWAVLGSVLLGGGAYAVDTVATSVLASTAAKDLFLKGDAKCTTCHDEADGPGVLAIGKTKHGTVADSRTPTCTSCHGDSADHLGYKGKDKPPKPDRAFNTKSKTPVAERNTACLSCHEKDTKRHLWSGSAHDVNDVACTSCHTMHGQHDKVRDKRTQPEVCFTCHKEQRAQYNKPSRHPTPEGKVACSDCHNAHGSAGPKLLTRDSVVDTCYACHMEKRGPFVRNHQPVSEDCTICHNPHGTVNPNLLKSRSPYLCQQCHEPSSHRGNVGSLNGTSGSSSANTVARGCLNCHTQIHGTNNPDNLNTERSLRR